LATQRLETGTRTALVEPVRWFNAFLRTANNGVDIRSDRAAYHPVENDEEPQSPHREAPTPSVYTDSYRDWLTDWMDIGQEPTPIPPQISPQ
jgi:hypothetical protein